MSLSEYWKEFFERVSLDGNGNLNCVIVTPTLPIEKGVSEYNTIKGLELSPEGYLYIYLM